MRFGLVLVLVLALGSGCTGEPRPPAVVRLERERARAAASMAAAGQSLADHGARLVAARGQPERAGALHQRVLDAQIAVECFDEAERAYLLAIRYHLVRDRLASKPDETVARMEDAARALETDAVKLAKAAHDGDVAAAERARSEAELDRAALKALRTALGIATRIPEPEPEPEPEPAP